MADKAIIKYKTSDKKLDVMLVDLKNHINALKDDLTALETRVEAIEAALEDEGIM